MRLLPIALFLLVIAACTPPVRTSPRIPYVAAPPPYTAVIHLNDPQPDLRYAQKLTEVKVKDRGWSRDCAYPEVVEMARAKAGAVGGNLYVIRLSKMPEYDKSDCSRILGDVYKVENIAGLEARIKWHPGRPLQAADLRGKSAERLPYIGCTIQCRLLGDFFNDMTIRTLTTFWADSTGMPSDPATAAIALRRAQLYFDLAELESRNLKSTLAALSPDVAEITRQFRTQQSQAMKRWRDQTTRIDAELQSSANMDAVLRKWEDQTREALQQRANLAPDTILIFKPKGQSTQ